MWSTIRRVLQGKPNPSKKCKLYRDIGCVLCKSRSCDVATCNILNFYLTEKPATTHLKNDLYLIQTNPSYALDIKTSMLYKKTENTTWKYVRVLSSLERRQAEDQIHYSIVVDGEYVANTHV